MPAVLVHGVPETAAVWDSLRRCLQRNDVVALSLPGFGNPRPEDFGATKDEYVGWLIDEIARLAELGPVDLVGHDWGGALVARAVSLRPDLVRTWASDAVGVASPEFTWHDLARIWQAAGEGERFWDDLLAQPVDERVGGFELLGVPPAGARVLAVGLDTTMAGCVLDLYRSALAVGQEWGPDFSAVAARGLALVVTDDPFGSTTVTAAAAARAGARIAALDGVGHWWMLQSPEPAAAVLQEFWAQP